MQYRALRITFTGDADKFHRIAGMRLIVAAMAGRFEDVNASPLSGDPEEWRYSFVIAVPLDKYELTHRIATKQFGTPVEIVIAGDLTTE